MSVIAEFAVPVDALAMSETLRATPEMLVEIERVVAHPGGGLTPYFWIRGGDREAFERAISADSSVEEYARLDVYEDETLYRAVWPADAESVGQAFVEAGGTILEAKGRAEEWEFRLRFDGDEALSAVAAYCEEHDVPHEVERVYHPSNPRAGGQFGVTPKQYEALTAAARRGFYEVPSDATMAEVGADVGVTQQALSKRLRRGHGNLVSNVLGIEEPASDE